MWSVEFTSREGYVSREVSVWHSVSGKMWLAQLMTLVSCFRGLTLCLGIYRRDSVRPLTLLLAQIMAHATPPERKIISRHRFTRPEIRLWLPVLMVGLVLLCGWALAPRFSLIDVLALLFLTYVAISAVVTVVEITVVEDGLIIHRLILPQRFVPWSAVDRAVVFAYAEGETGVHIEIASIGLYEGLSPLNRLPGPVYGQGLRQTIVITPETVENYHVLLTALEQNCTVVRRKAER